MAKITKEEALLYHSENRPGKIEVVPTVAHSTQRDLSLAYSPGVAEPCLEIEKNPDDAYKYTAKGNLVAVISNGTAVLGLGNLGALAGKPVMEGKGLLFKIFADIDVFDIEVDTEDIDKFVQTVEMIAPTFGGINLEDIKAPECFEIEDRLKKSLKIPLMHDDQHGTAIISSAGVVNALEIAGKKIDEVKMVVSGAGASAMACTKLIVSLGMKKENIIMCDSKGVLNKRREDINKYKLEFVSDTESETLEDAMKGADIFLGLSVKDAVTQDMVRSMAPNPIIFAMANPDPEIPYDKAMEARTDLLMATGRSDYPNQVNNVLGFPFIFRGALDVRATTINEEMKKAAVYAIANLAKADVPEEVNNAYNAKHLAFGREYFIPKPLDPRLLVTVAPAVAKAAMDSGVARNPIEDFEKYKEQLAERLGTGNKIIRRLHIQAKTNPKVVAFGDAENYNVLRAAQVAVADGIVSKAILIGSAERIREIIEEYGLHELLDYAEIADTHSESQHIRRLTYAAQFYKARQRKGISYDEANSRMFNPNYFGAMMVELNDADAFVTGYSTKYADALRPVLEVVRCNQNVKHVAGMYMMTTKKGTYFFADTTVNQAPDTDTIVNTTLLAEQNVRFLGVEPKIALVSYSNFGSVKEGRARAVHEAVTILHRDYPNMIVDGELQMNFALNSTIRDKKFPFSKLKGHKVNTIIFPNLHSGNIAYKMLQEIGGADAIGPILVGVKRPIHIVQLESAVRDIVNMTVIAVVDAQQPRFK